MVIAISTGVRAPFSRAISALFFAITAAVSGCGPSTPVRPNTTTGQLDLMGVLSNTGNGYTVSRYCTREAHRESKYTQCGDDLVFYVENYEPPKYLTEITCPDSNRQGAVRRTMCGDPVYSTSFLGSFSNMMHDKPGAFDSHPEKLDLDKFHSVARNALPDAERLRILAEERAYRADYPARSAAEQQQAAAQQQKANAERTAGRNAKLQEAIARFRSAAQVPKRVGMTVCSAKNRLAQVEQVSGDKINLSVIGRALGFLNRDDGRGPFEVDSSWTNSITERLAYGSLVLDPYYLFQGLSNVGFATQSARIWDDATQWGVCDYRIG